MSFGGSKSGGSETIIQDNSLDPLAQEAFSSVMDESKRLYAGNGNQVYAPINDTQREAFAEALKRRKSPFVDAASQAATQGLQQNYATQPFQNAQTTVDQFTSGQAANPFTSSEINLPTQAMDAAARSASQAVRDRFAAAGRSDSGAEAGATARAVTEAVSPFAFQAEQAGLDRQYAANEANFSRQLQGAGLASQNFAVQNQNQLGLFGQLGALDSLNFADVDRELAVGNALQDNQQGLFDAPYEAFERFANPLIAAAGGFPIDSTQNSNQSSYTFGGSVGLL